MCDLFNERPLFYAIWKVVIKNNTGYHLTYPVLFLCKSESEVKIIAKITGHIGIYKQNQCKIDAEALV